MKKIKLILLSSMMLGCCSLFTGCGNTREEETGSDTRTATTAGLV